jgi:hypothetical protein
MTSLEPAMAPAQSRAMSEKPESTLEHVRKANGRGGATRWKKGFCPNPGGRPGGVKELRELAQQHGPEAIQTLVARMRSKNERVSVAAAEVLLDRGYGKAPQAISVTAGPPLLIGDIPHADSARAYAVLMNAEPESVDLGTVRFLPAPTPEGT